MRTMQLLHITALLALLCATSLHAGVKRNKDFDKIMPSTLKHPPETEARLDKWFRDSKFGAFIHFCAYSPLDWRLQYAARSAIHALSWR